MLDNQMQTLLSAFMAVCVLGSLLNLSKVNKRGLSAYLMSAAFLTLGTTIFLFKSQVSQTYIAIGAMATAGLLVGDAYWRLRNGPGRGRS